MIVLHETDRVSGLYDNGLTPLQEQQDDQPDDVTLPENAIEDDVVDIRAIYLRGQWIQMTCVILLKL